jgi:4,5-dihydroxyphthalate decarboxylase
MYKRQDAGIEELSDLNGADVGIVNWQTTTGLWQRGIAADQYGLDLESVHWHAAGSEIVDLGELPGYDVTYLEGTGSRQQLERLLEAGELDAVFHPVRIQADNAVRIFEEPVAVEQAYYERTSIFPIMHTVVVKDELLEAEPWVAQKLLDAFERAKRVCLDRLEKTGWLPIVWSGNYLERQQALFGEDPWEYGLTADNRTALERLQEYAADQAVIEAPVPLDELFALEHLNSGRFGGGETEP